MMMRNNGRPGLRAALFLGLALTIVSGAAAQQPVPPGATPARPMAAPPKPGVCPLPTLPELPAIGDSTFFTERNVPHGQILQVEYTNFAGQAKRMHVYLPPEYERNTGTQYPVLYLAHGGGDDDSKWSSTDRRSGGNAGRILDNLIAAG